MSIEQTTSDSRLTSKFKKCFGVFELSQREKSATNATIGNITFTLR